jgi:hypothetical protein
MKFFKGILREKPIYPFDPTPQVSQHLENNVCDAVREFLKDFKDYLPPADATEHAKGAHDAVDDLLRWISVEDCQNQTIESQKTGDGQ